MLFLINFEHVMDLCLQRGCRRQRGNQQNEDDLEGEIEDEIEEDNEVEGYERDDDVEDERRRPRRECVEPDITFRYGRVDCPTSPTTDLNSTNFPHPHDGMDGVRAGLGAEFGFNDREIVAILGKIKSVFLPPAVDVSHIHILKKLKINDVSNVMVAISIFQPLRQFIMHSLLCILISITNLKLTFHL